MTFEQCEPESWSQSGSSRAQGRYHLMGLRRSDHRHRRQRLSRFVLDGIKVASPRLPIHSRPFLPVLMILAQVKLSKTLYYRGLEEWRTATNQASFPRGGGLRDNERACGWHERWESGWEGVGVGRLSARRHSTRRSVWRWMRVR